MESSQQHMVAFLRMVHARAGGTGAILNLIRASEVRGGADIIALTDLVSHPQLKMDLAKHAMDEARHSYLLLRRMTQLGFAAYRLPPELDRLESLFERSRARDVKQVYTDRGSIDDAELMEIMMVAYIPENDAAVKLQANYDALSDDPDSQAVITSILRDEERHIEYLGSWLKRFEQRISPRAVAAVRERLQEAFKQIDVVYYGALHEYFERAAA